MASPEAIGNLGEVQPIFPITVEESSIMHSLWDPPLMRWSGLVGLLALLKISLPEEPGGPGTYRATVLHVCSVPAAPSTDAGCWELGPPLLTDGGK